MRLWGGRFSEANDPRVADFTRSIEVDRELAVDDLVGSIAHVRGLGRAGLLTPDEVDDARRRASRACAPRSRRARSPGTRRSRTSTSTSRPPWPRRIGPLAGKLHTGRSRNDQVATDLRLWLRRTIDRLDGAIVDARARARRPGRARRRRGPAGLDPHPARPAGPARPSPAGLRRDARARPRPAGRRAAAGERLAARRGRAGRGRLPARPRRRRPRELGFDGVTRELARRGERPRLRRRVPGRGRPRDGPPQPARRGDHLVVEPALRVRPGRRRVLDRLVDDAQQEEPRPGRARPRPGRPGHRRADRRPGPAQGPAAGLPARPPGGQGAAVRDGGRRSTPRSGSWPGCSTRWRSTASGCGPPPTEGYTTATAVADALVRRGVPFRVAHHVVGSLVAQAEEAGVGLDAVPGRDDRPGPRRRPATRPPRALAAEPGIGDELRAAASIDGALASCDVIGGTAPRPGGAPRSPRPATRLGAARPDADARAPRPIRRAPKVLLHDHLDGGLRPRTVIELADETGYRGLPTTDEAELGRVVHPRRRPQVARAVPRDVRPHGRGHADGRRDRPGRRASAPRTWPPTGSCTPRCATRPSCRRSAGCRSTRSSEAWLDGFRDGAERAAAAGRPDRHPGPGDRDAPGRPVARDRRPRPALPRRGASSASTSPAPRPASRRAACADAFRPPHPRELPPHDPRRRGLRPAVDPGGARARARSASATASGSSTTSPSAPDGRVALGRLAAYVRDRRIPLELCPTSNVHTGLRALDRRASVRPAPPAPLPGHAQHRQPAHVERDACRREFAALDAAFGIGLGEMEWLTLNAIKSAFLPFDERLRLIDEVIKPGYARLRREAAG